MYCIYYMVSYGSEIGTIKWWIEWNIERTVAYTHFNGNDDQVASNVANNRQNYSGCYAAQPGSSHMRFPHTQIHIFTIKILLLPESKKKTNNNIRKDIRMDILLTSLLASKSMKRFQKATIHERATQLMWILKHGNG